MLGVLASILGNGDVIKKGMDLIDDVHSSDEEMERVKAQAKIDTMAVKMITKDSTMASTLGMNLPSRFITGEARAVTRRLRKRARATGKMRFRK